MKKNLNYWFKTTLLFGLLASGFSVISIFMEYSHPPDDPLVNATLDHILGHIVFGMLVAIPALSLKHIVTSGLFAIILDADHLVNFLGIDIISRFSHSVPFAVIACIVMFFVFGRKDYLLVAISLSAVLSHMSFDTLRGSGYFPIFAPFDLSVTSYQMWEGVLLLGSATCIVLSVKLIILRKSKLEKDLSF